MSTHPPRPVVVLVLAATLASLGACRGHFSNRKEETASGTIAVPAGTKRVRFVVPPGGLSVEAGTKPGIIAYSAQLKRAADDAAGLASLASLRLEPHVESDSMGVDQRPQDPVQCFQLG